jgi:hypothetical protein
MLYDDGNISKKGRGVETEIGRQTGGDSESSLFKVDDLSIFYIIS